MKSAILLFLCLAGCAPARFYKPGATRDDWARDHQFCRLYAQRLNENYSWSRSWTQAALERDCLAERGWTKQ